MFDVVLVDAPPLQGVADTVVLSKVTDRTLLVVRADRTPVVDVRRSTALLERVGATLAGAVLNALPRKLPTGTAWHGNRAVSSPPSAGLGLMNSAGTVYPAEPVPPTTVRGRARVVPSTVGTPEAGTTWPDAEPEPPNLPAQRDGNDD
jgi:hypothetical protein